MNYEIMYSENDWICDFDLSRGFNKYAVYDVRDSYKRKVYFADISQAYGYWNKCVQNRKRIEKSRLKVDWEKVDLMAREDAVDYIVGIMKGEI